MKAQWQTPQCPQGHGGPPGGGGESPRRGTVWCRPHVPASRDPWPVSGERGCAESSTVPRRKEALCRLVLWMGTRVWSSHPQTGRDMDRGLRATVLGRQRWWRRPQSASLQPRGSQASVSRFCTLPSHGPSAPAVTAGDTRKGWGRLGASARGGGSCHLRTPMT